MFSQRPLPLPLPLLFVPFLLLHPHPISLSSLSCWFPGNPGCVESLVGTRRSKKSRLVTLEGDLNPPGYPPPSTDPSSKMASPAAAPRSMATIGPGALVASSSPNTVRYPATAPAPARATSTHTHTHTRTHSHSHSHSHSLASRPRTSTSTCTRTSTNPPGHSPTPTPTPSSSAKNSTSANWATPPSRTPSSSAPGIIAPVLALPRLVAELLTNPCCQTTKPMPVRPRLHLRPRSLISPAHRSLPRSNPAKTGTPCLPLRLFLVRPPILHPPLLPLHRFRPRHGACL